MTITTRLQILLLEDSPLDAELVARRLESCDLHVQLTHVATGSAFRDALGACDSFDLILSDFDLPDIDGMTALKLARQYCPDAPFIFVSGKLGEEAAVQSLHEGATDYVVKHRLDRLIPAVRRALHERQERRQREAAERALRDAQSRLRASLEASEVATWLWDVVNDRVSGDRNLHTMFNIDSINDNGEPIAMFIRAMHPEDRPRVNQIISAALESASHRYEAEYRLLDSRGGVRHLIARGRIERDNDGKPLRLAGIVLDISAQKQAEDERLRLLDRERAALAEATRSAELARRLNERVERQDRLFDTALSTLTDQVFVFDRDHRVVYANQPLLTMWQRTATEAYGKTPAHLNYPIEVATTLTRDLRHVFQTRRTAVNDIALPQPDGSTLIFEYSLSPVTDSNGEVEAVAGVARDVTARTQMEHLRERSLQAERAARLHSEHYSRLKDEFLATLSHELRTPLNAILGWSQLVRRKVDAGHEVARGLEIIERNARAQARLIEDLLDMSRIISGKVRLNLSQIDVAAVARAAIDVIQPAADARRIEIRFHAEGEVGPVLADGARIQQVVWNLLSNAVKFTPVGGSILVEVTRGKDAVCIAVQDTGAGIDPGFLPLVFERFLQADSSITRSVGGLGLGLSIVKHLVETHGGSVQAFSDGEGKGSRFVVSLPQHPTDRPAVTHRSELSSVLQTSGDALASPSAQPLLGLTVLAIDDEADARLLLSHVLEASGAQVTTATSARQARELLEHQRPHIVVSDIGMPEEDGYTFIQQLRHSEQQQGRPRLAAIALTAFARPADADKAIAAGFDAHLHKPLDVDELIHRIKEKAASPTTT